MEKQSQLSVEDYVLFLKESASHTGKTNKILFLLGSSLSLLMIGRVVLRS